MELRKHLSFKVIAAVVYIVCFLAYIIIGLRPVEAAKSYVASGSISIPRIGLNSSVVTVEPENGTLPTPDQLVGSYSRAENKAFLFGHSSTVFADLDQIELEDEIVYNDKKYIVSKIEIIPKSEIRMGKLLKREEKDTIVLMTCAGQDLKDQDATHRLIIEAKIE